MSRENSYNFSSTNGVRGLLFRVLPFNRESVGVRGGEEWEGATSQEPRHGANEEKSQWKGPPGSEHLKQKKGRVPMGSIIYEGVPSVTGRRR